MSAILDKALTRMVAVNPILANTNLGTANWEDAKNGPNAIVRVGTKDYRMVLEGISAPGGVTTSKTGFASSTDAMSWTKYAGNPVFVATQAWENNETAITSVVWDPIAGHFKGYYHGGNNAGPRQIGLATSTDLVTWTRYSNLPILANGASGAWDDSYIADAKVIRVASNDWRMLYRGVKAGTSVAQIGYATSTDGLAWTKSASNPVIRPSASGWDSVEILSPGWFRDSGGRFHAWWPGSNVAAGSSSGNGIGYAYSDDGVTWTKGANNPVYSPTGNSADPDQNIGDTVEVLNDGDVVYVNTSNFNLTYQGGSRLDGRGQAWCALEAPALPTRPGRHFRSSSAQQRVAVPSGAALLGQSIFSIYLDFKAPKHNTFRHFYTEYVAFNEQIYVRLTNTGVPDVWYRTTSGNIAQITGTARLDDNQWHRLLFVRSGLSAFTLYADGVAIGGYALSPGTDANAPTIAIGNWDPSEATDEPTMGTIRRVVTNAGYAFTTADESALWNSGLAGGARPGSGTTKLDLALGSGGAGGPDVDSSANAFSCAVTGALMVDAQPVSGGLGSDRYLLEGGVGVLLLEAAAGALLIEGLTGAVSKTIPMLTMAASAAVDVVGSFARAIPMVTMLASAAVDVGGTSARSMPMITVAPMQTTVTISGTIAKPVPMLTLAAQATVDLAGTLPARAVPMLTVASVAVVPITGTHSPTVPMLTVAPMQATLPITGTAAKAFPMLTFASAGSLGAITSSATLTASVPMATMASAGTSTVTGALTPSLPMMLFGAQGTAVQPTVNTDGTLVLRTPMLTASFAGTAVFPPPPFVDLPLGATRVVFDASRMMVRFDASRTSVMLAPSRTRAT